jgi:hypothetical protein
MTERNEGGGRDDDVLLSDRDDELVPAVGAKKGNYSVTQLNFGTHEL